VLLTVDSKGISRSHSPAFVDIDFAPFLRAAGEAGTFDIHTIEVVAYDSANKPRIYDNSRRGYEKYLLPWRPQKYYGIGKITLSFVMPDETCKRYAVYLDTVQSGLGKPGRYRGLVGDGDWFTEGFKRREINASGYDAFCDFDGDGDLDLFKSSIEPFLYYYENIGANRFEPRGKLSSNGEVLLFPMDGNNRSWLSVEFCDWDKDGDQDMFVYFPTGPYQDQLVRYENVTPPGGGSPSFVDRGAVLTPSGKSIGSIATFVDWDGDGKTDLLGGRDSLVVFYRNIGSGGSVEAMQVAEGIYIKANGYEIELERPRVDCSDIDNDGDPDLFVGTEDGRIYWFQNVGTRTSPVFTIGRIIAFYEYMDARAGVKVADFDGDGLLDFVAGRFWERTQWGEQPRVYGRLYKNVGSPTAPRFEARDADGGSPYTQGFQIVDAVRQNGVRAVDWNNDGKTDLIASDTDGFVWYFQNLSNQLFPIFAPGVKLRAGDEILRVYGEERESRAAGYARSEICDWNNDGKKDLLVADGRGWLMLYLNKGSDSEPVLASGRRIFANGKPIDGTARGSVLVCDWDNDGRKDVIFGMVGERNFSQYYDWPHLNADPSGDRGFLFYRNTGTDQEPVLAYPKWIRSGAGPGQVIDYSRPNLGDFVDWDGDGKKDFIACEFENSIRLYKNTAAETNAEPRFGSSTSGIFIVKPWTVQLISGADALDWNEDGDVDILTGQGHGGSGIRFYERDFINDFVNNTFPLVTIQRIETKNKK
jgi:hypothetical protein